jgi:hypothetical protein
MFKRGLTRVRAVAHTLAEWSAQLAVGSQQVSNRELSELLKALGMGVGFVWLFGFAIGYPNDFVPWALFVVWVGLMWASFKLFTK